MGTPEHRMDDTLIEVPRGLGNVAVVATSISDVRGMEGYYQYRQYDAVELARTRSFEEVCYLFLYRELPSPHRLRAFLADMSELLAEVDIDGLVRRVSERHGMDVISSLKAAWPLLAAERRMRPLYDLAPLDRRRDVLLLSVVVPAFIVRAWAYAHGTASSDPLPDAGIVATYLTGLTGRRPTAEEERALTAYLIAVIDHGLNASTFTARVIASTGADASSAFAGALGSLSGPLHGGAPSRVLDALDRIENRADVESWIRAELSAGRKLMGFGHAVYRTVDPRSRLLKSVATSLSGERVAMALEFEKAAERILEEMKPGRALHANVEFYASVVMERVGIPRELFTATFALARAVGWGAHILEQAEDSKIFRPAARYVGPPMVG